MKGKPVSQTTASDMLNANCLNELCSTPTAISRKPLNDGLSTTEQEQLEFVNISLLVLGTITTFNRYISGANMKLKIQGDETSSSKGAFVDHGPLFQRIGRLSYESENQPERN